ncbi:MAG: PKHD-type hydroxylase [Halioglobus sp.]|jgi:PKHD-type hydroxylase
MKLSRTDVCMKIFNDEQCNSLLEDLDETAWRVEEMKLVSGENDWYRKVQSVFCPIDAENYFPLISISHMISEINLRNWQFDITGMSLVEDHPKIFKYIDERGDFYDWHQDLGPSASQRKLSFSIQLSHSDDYEGGDLELFGNTLGEDPDKEKRRERGNIIVFPSYEYHRVKVVTKGVRYSLVGWIEGPAFQ